jgi:hypothetical protein
VAELNKVAIAKGNNILKYGKYVPRWKHPDRILGAYWHDDSGGTNTVGYEIVTKKASSGGDGTKGRKMVKYDRYHHDKAYASHSTATLEGMMGWTKLGALQVAQE